MSIIRILVHILGLIIMIKEIHFFIVTKPLVLGAIGLFVVV